MGKRLFQLGIKVLGLLSEVIYPFKEECISCGEYSSEFLCKCCSLKLVRLQDSYQIKGSEGDKFQVYSISYYSSVMKKLILEFKYKKNFFALELLTELLRDFILTKKLTFDYITYVPASRKTLKKRGFNQSRLLAHSTAKELGCEAIELLQKFRETKEQKKLNTEERWNNLKEAFKTLNKRDIEGKRLLLIDDVVTTGATVWHCRDELLKSGALEVLVLTLAKSNV